MLEQFKIRMLVSQYESQNPRIKSKTAVRFAGDFFDCNFEHLSITLDIIDSNTNLIALSHTLKFLDATSPYCSTLETPTVMERLAYEAFTHDSLPHFVYFDNDFLRNNSTSQDP